jgi:hypothetical protein
MTPSRNRFGIGLAVAAALGIVCHTTPAMAIDGEVISVTRVYSDGSAEMVEYVVEDTGAWSIKFEDADVGLGEDHEQMTDIFVLRIPNSNGSVTVETKAATSTATSVLTGAGESSLDGLGFNVTLDSIEDDVYTISVTSESNHRALSHVTFFFFEGNFAEPLYD